MPTKIDIIQKKMMQLYLASLTKKWLNPKSFGNEKCPFCHDVNERSNFERPCMKCLCSSLICSNGGNTGLISRYEERHRRISTNCRWWVKMAHAILEEYLNLKGDI